jgi:N-acetylglucosaminyldiphosphoundecaprenol N-acetyl-beta-D-mannosaminyltransferase
MATQSVVLERSTARRQELTASHRGGRDRIEFAGVLIDKVDLRGALERIESFLHSESAHQVVTVNLDFLSIAQRDDEFRQTLNEADLAVPDGMPLVWFSRLQGDALTERVTGVALVDACCRMAHAENRPVFLLGAGPGVAAIAAERLTERFPGLRVAAYSPPVGPIDRRENARILRTIRAAQPGFVFVALGAPRQDLWIRENLRRLDAQVAMGVGCVLDVLAGSVHRAPPWMQQLGLEWAFRLVHEPSRLWRRYLLNDSRMFGKLLLDLTRSAPRVLGADRIVVST